jgi:hypothetical protein
MLMRFIRCRKNERRGCRVAEAEAQVHSHRYRIFLSNTHVLPSPFAVAHLRSHVKTDDGLMGRV